MNGPQQKVTHSSAGADQTKSCSENGIQHVEDMKTTTINASSAGTNGGSNRQIPRWSSPPIQTKGLDSNLAVMLAITTSQMRRFGATEEEINKLREDMKLVGCFADGCDLIRQWFPLDIDLLILNNCPYNNCVYPGCPKSCAGREKVKVRARGQKSNGSMGQFG